MHLDIHKMALMVWHYSCWWYSTWQGTQLKKYLSCWYFRNKKSLIGICRRKGWLVLVSKSRKVFCYPHLTKYEVWNIYGRFTVLTTDKTQQLLWLQPCANIGAAIMNTNKIHLDYISFFLLGRYTICHSIHWPSITILKVNSSVEDGTSHNVVIEIEL